MGGVFAACLLMQPAAADTTGPLPCSVTPLPPAAGHIFNRTPIPDVGEAQIRQVHLSRLPVFDESDPGENNALFRWGNRLHVMTGETVISNLVLFKAGEVADTRTLAESARILRSERYLYDADIRVYAVCDNSSVVSTPPQVDVEVITRDIWSFTPELSYDRAGGENSLQLGVRDSNFLGTGRLLSLSYRDDVDRTSTRFVFRDRNIRGSRLATRIALADSDDGHNYLFRLGKPFYALDSTRSWNVELHQGLRNDSQYYKSREISALQHRFEDFSVGAGRSRGLNQGVVRRTSWGVRFTRRTLQPIPGEPSPVGTQSERRTGYPYVQYEHIEDNFIIRKNLDQIYRTEDLYTGRRVFARVGVAAQAFGNRDSRLVFEGNASDTLMATRGKLLQHSTTWEGLWNHRSHKLEDLVLTYQLRYFRRQSQRRAFVARTTGTFTKGLSPNRQVVLGGNTGLRGFDNRFQTGHASALVTVEQRYYTDIHVLRLARLGWALFFDAGRTWDRDFDNGTGGDISANAGIGLRFASTKADYGRVIHVDLAFPFTQHRSADVPSIQLVINVKDGL